MEMSAGVILKKVRSQVGSLLICLLLSLVVVNAQPPIKNYTVKDNRMFIALGKTLSDASIDSFSRKFNLSELDLKKYIRGVLLDSLKAQGWKVELNNSDVFIISKPLFSLDNIDDPGAKFLLTQKEGSFSALFPAVSMGVMYGYNKFRNKEPFAVKDSVVTFYLRDNEKANKVMLSGSFNDWKPNALAMQKTDSGWVANVKLGPGKFWYKFIVDGNWMTDPDNRLSENDGKGNVNSVYFRPNHTFRLDGYTNARRVYLSGRFNNWDERELLMEKTANGWELPLYLAEGTHTYRFIVDRRWMEDPANPDHYPNEFGQFNSVIRIGKPYLFYLEGYTNAKQVALAGSFNGWRKDELFMTKTDKGWELPYTLGPGNYEYNFIIDGKWAASSADQDNKKSSGNFYFVIDPNHTFQLKGFENARSVYIAGDFNNWSPNTFAMKKQEGIWTMDVHLSPGKHLYKFVVDGKWILDPGNELWEQNQYSTGNSVLWIDEN